MLSDRKLANTVGGKTARACDNCMRKRARWYCAADDAFLCQGCDSSVHSANTLARRHDRVRLKTSSIKPSKEAASSEAFVPSWHHGFTRKARTPRFKKNAKSSKSEKQAKNPLHLVPELCSDETSHEENEEQLLYRVPSFDPFVAELCASSNSNEAVNTINNDEETTVNAAWNESKSVLFDCGQDMNNHFHGSLPSEMELAEFAADVESLLGKGLDDESFDMEGLGLMDCKEKDFMGCSLGSGQVKVEDDDGGEDVVAQEFGITRGHLEMNFDNSSLITCEEDNRVKAENIIIKGSGECCEENGKTKKRVILLRLDLDSVITAWDEKGSPWTNGERPTLESYECWPYCMGACGRVHHFGDVGMMGHAPLLDGGREARVSRYREKRRTRLFSKKIRYEVRKLNAEKRPRMKGRFVKRANFTESGFPLPNK